MILDYQCVTEEAVASSRPMKARQYVTPETLTFQCTCASETRFSIIRGRYRRWPPMNSRMMDVGGIAEISSGDRATM